MSQDDIVKLIAIGIPILMIIFSIVGRIWCYISEKNIEKIDAEIQRLRTLNDAIPTVGEAIKESSVTAKEAEKAFKTFKETLDTPLLTANELREKYGYDKIKEQLEDSKYGIAFVDDNTTIEQVSPPKEYCQCDYCGTFYNEFVSNCKNCGAQIRMPSELYKRDYIIKVNYPNSRHNVFDI